ncbi:MAG: 50S ribosomal protein L25 [Flavobacteriales bacterium]|nr:50S ribosomal protein L25 [Flavobacteriales bacterium]
MKKVELSGSLRQGTGSSLANRERRNEHVPCVLYGGPNTVHFTVEEKQLSKVVHTPEAYRIELDINGTKTMALLQETQFHPLTDKMLHADFVEMSEDKPAMVTLTLKLTGQSPGVKKGGRLVQGFRKLRVKGLPGDIPEHLELEISGLELNDAVHVSDLAFKGLTVCEPASDVVVAVRHQKKEEEAAPTATAATAAAPAAAAPAAAAPAKPAAKK